MSYYHNPDGIIEKDEPRKVIIKFENEKAVLEFKKKTGISFKDKEIFNYSTFIKNPLEL